MRSRSSAAALRLKVSTRIRSGAMPRRSIRSATAATIVVVFPVPGPASTSSGPPSWSTTCCCAWSRRGAEAAGKGRRTRRYAGAWEESIHRIPADATDISRPIHRRPSVSRRALPAGLTGGPHSPAGTALVPPDGPPGRAKRRPFGQVVLERHAVVTGRRGAVGVDHAPPRHRAAVDRHHPADLPGARSGTEVLGDVTVGHHPAGLDRVHHVERVAGEVVDRR